MQSPEKNPRIRTYLSRSIATLLVATLLSPEPAQGQSAQQPDKKDAGVVAAIYLPLLEAENAQQEAIPVSEQELKSVIQDFFPELEEFSVVRYPLSEELEPAQDQAIATWAYWLQDLNQHQRQVLDQLAAHGLPNKVFQDTVEEFTLDLNHEGLIGETNLAVTGEGKVLIVKLNAHYADPEVIAAEMVHPFQASTDLSEGRTPLFMEVASNLVHLVWTIDWISKNQYLIDQGTPEEAIVMPIVNNERYVLYYPEPSQFTQRLQEVLTNSIVTWQEAPRNLPTYTGDPNPGFDSSIHLLTNYFREGLSDEYQLVIERAALNAFDKMSHLHTKEDVIALLTQLYQGNANEEVPFSEEVNKVLDDLQEAQLIASPEEWQALLDKYSAPNTDAGEGLHPVIAAHPTERNSTREITLNVAALLMGPDQQHGVYTELLPGNKPEVSIYAQVEGDDGEPMWIKISATVQASRPEDTFIYTFSVPQRVVYRDAWQVRYFNLEGKQLVFEAKVPEVLSIPIPDEYTAYFSATGSFTTDASAQKQDSESDMVEAELAEKPEPKAMSAATETEVTKVDTLPAEAQEKIEKLRERKKQLETKGQVLEFQSNDGPMEMTVK